MTKQNKAKVQPIHTFAHTLINKLSAIVGFCQLLEEGLPEDSKSLDRVRQIQSIASSLVEEIKTKQRNVNAIGRAG